MTAAELSALAKIETFVLPIYFLESTPRELLADYMIVEKLDALLMKRDSRRIGHRRHHVAHLPRAERVAALRSDGRARPGHRSCRDHQTQVRNDVYIQVL